MKKILFIAMAGMVLAACHTAKPGSGTMVSQWDKQGHRGCRGLMPENTIPAMLKAIDLGVTTLEMDLVISADHKVVVSHDVYFNENITTRPDGSYMTKAEAQKHLLYKMPYDSIRRYDVGLKPHPDFPQQQKLAAVKPLLEDLLEATESYAKKEGRSLMYNIEIKSRPDNDGKKHPPVAEFVELAMNVIQDKGIGARTTIQSFDPRALQVMHTKYPGITTSLLIENNDGRSLDAQLQELGFIPNVYSPHYSLVTPALLKQCHDKNIRVIPWTVNSVDLMKKLLQMGVDGLISDYPNLYSQL